MNKNKLRLSLIFNIIIVCFVLFSVLSMAFNLNFMTKDNILSSNGLTMLKYYTVDSNILMGICSIIVIIFELLYLNNKIKDLPKIVYLIKLIGVVGVSLTFLVVVFFLLPTTKNFALMFSNANLFMHALTPIVSIISFILFERNNLLKIKDSFIGISSMIIYCIFYSINVLTHANNGIVSNEYDFYGFLFGNVINAVFVIPIIILFTFGISTLLIVLNKDFKQNN